MSELVLETSPIVLEKATGTEVVSSSTTVLPVKQDSIVEGFKKEYSIVGDGLYASVNAEEAPQWLTGILDNVISAKLDSNLTSLEQANLNIVNSLSELEIAKNQYQELINIDATIDSVVTSRLATLNATVYQNTANIMELDINKVTETEAIAIATTVVQSSLDSGAINARVGNVETALATTNVALATTTTALETQFDAVSAVTSTLENNIIATANKAEANFSYNATVTLNNHSYSTGFGLATSLIDAGIPVGSSEFWVDAEKFRVTAPSIGTGLPVFSIDGNNVVFNGKVSFNSVTGTPTHTSGIYANRPLTDVVGSTYTATDQGNRLYTYTSAGWVENGTPGALTAADLSPTGTTVIDGGRIETDSLSVISANLGNITAGSLGIGLASNGQKRFDVQTNGTMTIRDAAGNVIIASGSSDAFPALGSLATKDEVGSSEIAEGAVGITQFGTVIQSTDYDEVLKKGWRITKTGDATFYGYLKAQGLGEINVLSTDGEVAMPVFTNGSGFPYYYDLVHYSPATGYTDEVNRPHNASTWDLIVVATGNYTTNTGSAKDWTLTIEYSTYNGSFWGSWAYLTSQASAGIYAIPNSTTGGVGNVSEEKIRFRLKLTAMNSVSGPVYVNISVIKIVRSA